MRYFRVIKIRPTVIHNLKHGIFDLRTITDEKAKELYDDRFPYLELTSEGKAKLYPSPPPPPPVTAKEIIDKIKKSEQRVEVLKMMSDNEQLFLVIKAGEKRLKQLDENLN